MTSKEIIISGVIGGLLMYFGSMVDYRMITERDIDCFTGIRSFRMSARECRTIPWYQVYFPIDN